MKKLLFLLFPITMFSQGPQYNITVNTKKLDTNKKLKNYINGDINFLADRFDTFTCIDSSPWKLHKIDRLEFRNDTLINTSIMRWTDSRKIFNDFIRKRDLYLRLYKGIDRYIYNEDIKYKTFQGTAISSWQEGIEDNTIVLYNNRYA